MKRLFKNKPTILAIIALVITLPSCRTTSTTKALLQDIETYIDARPDSALATLQAIPSNKIHGKSTKALYNLLTVEALDKNDIDVTDISTLQPAMDWYSKHGTRQRKAMTLFYEGRIHLMAGRLIESLIAFDTLVPLAEELNDIHLLGLLYSSKSAIYSQLLNTGKALECEQKSYQYLVEYGDEKFLPKAYYGLSLAYYNKMMYDESEQFLNKLDSVLAEKNDSTLHGYSKVLRAMLFAEYHNDHKQAQSLFAEAINTYKVGLAPSELGEYALCLAKSGKGEMSEMLINQLSDDETMYNFWMYRKHIAEGDTTAALNNLIKAYHGQGMVVRDMLEESVVSKVSDHHREQTHLREKQLASKRLVIAILLLSVALLLLAMASITIVKNNQLRNQAVEYINLMESFEDLKMNHSNLMKLLDEEKLKNVYFPNFSTLKRILNYEKSMENIDENKSIETLKSLLNDLKRLSSQSEFESLVDLETQGFMTKLRKSFPKWSNSDYRLMCYIVIGFKPVLISNLLGIEKENLYNRKARLIRKIENSDVEEKGFFLSMIANGSSMKS